MVTKSTIMMVDPMQENDVNCNLLALIDAASKVEPLPESTRSVSRPIRDLPTSKSLSSTNRWKGLSFPVILMQLLDDPSNSMVLSWLPNGSSFIIADPEKFATELMPRAFQVIRFPTFLKRLERWGFTQIRRPGHSEHGAYRHPEFRRGDLANCRNIQYHPGRSVKFAKSVRADKADKALFKSSSAIDSSLKNLLASGSGLGQQQQQQQHVPKDFLSQLKYAQRLTAQAALQKRAAFFSRGEAMPTFSQDDVNKETKRVVGAALASVKRGKFLERQLSEQKKAFALLESSNLFSFSGAKDLKKNAPSALPAVYASASPTPTLGLRQQERRLDPSNLNMMASSLLNSSRCIGTHETLAKMAKVAQIKAKFASWQQQQSSSNNERRPQGTPTMVL